MPIATPGSVSNGPLVVRPMPGRVHTEVMADVNEPGLEHIPDADELGAFDLDEDGKISILEEERARLGLVDARLEEIAHEGGVKGKIADVAHKIVDKLDND